MTPVRVTPDLLRSRPLPAPVQGADKNSRGTALIVGGSAVSPGGAMLAATAAFRAGAGKIKLMVPRTLATAVAVSFPEAGVHGFSDDGAGNPLPIEAAADITRQMPTAHALLVGPGITDGDAAGSLSRLLLQATDVPALVLDAMALGGLWDHGALTRRLGDRLAITPHAGEMASLMGVHRDVVDADPERIASRAAEHLGCIVVLKGADTWIATRDGECRLHRGGVSGLATSGSGDVLAGAIVALAARGAGMLDAALWGVYLHARAGERLAERIGPLGFMARELPGELPALMRLMQ